MIFQKLFLIVFVFCTINFVNTKKKRIKFDSSNFCTGKSRVPVDNKFFSKMLSRGVYFPMQRKNFNNPAEYRETVDDPNKKYKHKKCGKAQVMYAFGTQEIGIEIKYKKANQLRVVVNRAPDNIFGQLYKNGNYVDSRLELTDNSTYFLIMSCLFGTGKTWHVLSPLKKLPSSSEKKILKTIEKIGFSRDEVVYRDSDEDKVYKIDKVKC